MDSSSFSFLLFPTVAPELLTALRPRSVPDFFVLFLILWASLLWLTRGIWWDQEDPHKYIWFEIPQLKEGGIHADNTQTRDIVEHLKKLGKKIVIFWGSQSGTSERFAYRLSRDLKLKLGLESLVADLSDYDAGTIASLTSDHLAFFLISTYGEGDPSDNSTGLWDWLKTIEGNPNALSQLKFLAFGFGNSSYVHYNRVVDVVDQKLRAAGAEALSEVGRADDVKGETEEHVLSWKESTISLLSKHFDIEVMNRQAEPTFTVVEDTSLDLQDLYLGDPTLQERGTGYSPVAALPIKSHRELFNDTATRNCLHLDIDLSEHPRIAYKTGDHLGVWAVNPDSEVDMLVHALALNEQRHHPIIIKANERDVKINVPSPTTIDALLRYYLEICAVVSRDTMQSLKPFAPSAESSAWLDNLCKDPELYSAYLSEHHLTIGKLLWLASRASSDPVSWTGLSIANLIDLIPRMQPRYYSISSSSVVTPRIAHLTVLVSPQALPQSTSEVIPGLATTYLHRSTKQLLASESESNTQRPNESYPVPAKGKIFAFTRRSKFKLPVSASCPLIMIAAGTGLAPFRAFIQERARLKDSGRDIGQMVLYFGCQHPERDFIYADELRELEARLEGKLSIVTAYSRLDKEKKVHVQHKLIEQGQSVMDLIDQGANVYVCGRTAMARDVARAVRELGVTLGQRTVSEAESWVDTMKRSRKWQEDVWG
jgi:NADPH-ferrihemoprotein reductase